MLKHLSYARFQKGMFYNNLIRLRPLNEVESTFPKLGEGSGERADCQFPAGKRQNSARPLTIPLDFRMIVKGN